MNATKQEKLEAAAKWLGFQNPELMLAYFKAKLLSDGLYEVLREKALQEKGAQ